MLKCWAPPQLTREVCVPMLWFLEREAEVLICEIRHADDSPEFELSISAPGIPERIERFDQPTVLIERWLNCQRELHSMGWRPKD